jgi:hypothetical protein
MKRSDQIDVQFYQHFAFDGTLHCEMTTNTFQGMDFILFHDEIDSLDMFRLYSFGFLSTFPHDLCR